MNPWYDLELWPCTIMCSHKCLILMCSHKCLSFEKRPMLYNWIFGCQGSMWEHTCVTLAHKSALSLFTLLDNQWKLQTLKPYYWLLSRYFDQCIFARYMAYMVPVQSMCVPILRSIGTKLAKLKKYAKIVFYLTLRDEKTVRHTSWGLFWSGTFETNHNVCQFEFNTYIHFFVYLHHVITDAHIAKYNEHVSFNDSI